ncbi:MAG: hypothetical protein ACI4NL_01390 [Christensenellales bacterium]
MNRKQGNNSKAPLCVKEGSKIKNFCGGIVEQEQSLSLLFGTKDGSLYTREP